MYPNQDVMYNMYSGSGHNRAMNRHYPVFASHNSNIYVNMPAGQGGAMMYAYDSGSAPPTAAAASAYGMHFDPAVTAAYEYNTNSTSANSGSGRGIGGGRGRGTFNHRGGGGFQRGGCAGFGAGAGAGAGGMNFFDQQALSDYEVHDNQLKAPVAVTAATVVPTLGSCRLFSRSPKPIVYGSRSVVRVCDAFQEGRCVAGDKCHDIHVKPEYLAETRMQMSSWLMNREEEFRHTLETNPNKTFRIFVADLKEVVEVPIASLVFTKGLYVDPTTRTKRARGTGNHAHSHTVMQVPTSCGLYSSDPALCKWGRWCNQVHIDHHRMQTKKEEFDQWFNELQSRYFSLSPDDNFTIHDPQLKTSISLPKFAIAGFSRGLFQGSMKKLASVCLLYQRGKCTAGTCCNQIHVVPQYLSLAREYATLEQTPNASQEEKQRVLHEMEQLRGPCIEHQQREQQEAERERAAGAAASQQQQQQQQEKRTPLEEDSADGNSTDHNTSNPSGKAGVEDELDSSGALFEHVQVDEDVEPASHTISANTSLTRRLNSSAPDMGISDGRHMNSDGSYSFNPYGSVTSLPEAATSYGRGPVMRGNSYVMENSGMVQHTPGNVQLHATTTKGTRRLVAVVSPDTSMSITEGHHGDDIGISGPVDNGAMAHLGAAEKHMLTPLQYRERNGMHRMAAVHRRNSGDGPFDGVTANEQSGSLHPLDFDASLHFSPSPLLGFDASNTSLYRNASIREEETTMGTNLRLAASNTSCQYHQGVSTNSQPYTSGPSFQYNASGSTGTRPRIPSTAAAAVAAAAASAMRPRVQRSSASLAEVSAPSTSNPNRSGTTLPTPPAKPSTRDENNTAQ